MANEVDMKMALDRIDHESVEANQFALKALLVSGKVSPAAIQASFDLYSHVRSHE